MVIFKQLKMHFVSYYPFFDDSFKIHKIDLSNKVYAWITYKMLELSQRTMLTKCSLEDDT